MVRKISDREKINESYDIKVNKLNAVITVDEENSEIEINGDNGKCLYLPFTPLGTFKYGDGNYVELCNKCFPLFLELSKICDVDNSENRTYCCIKDKDGNSYDKLGREHECYFCKSRTSDSYFGKYFTNIK